MSQDRIVVAADFADVIAEIALWAKANLKLAESEDLVIQATQKVVKGQTQLIGSIQGVNEAGERQTTTLRNMIEGWDVVSQKSRLASKSIKDQTDIINKNTAAQERSTAAAKKRANVQATQTRNFALSQLNLPASGVSAQTTFNVKDSVGQLAQFVRANKVSASQVKRIWQEAEQGRFRAYEGTNRQIQQRVFRIQQLRQKANQEFNRGVKDSFAKTAAATDRATASTKRFAKQTKNANDRAQGVLLSWQSIGRIIAGQVIRRAFLAFIQVVRQSVEVADDFLIKIGEVRTLSQENQISTEEWAKGLRSLSDSFGTDILDQTEAAYQTLSNQIAKGAEAFKFLESANKLALATVSSSADAVNALTAVLNSYGLGAERADEVSASLFKTVELGRIRLSEISNSIGTVTALASKLNIGFNDVNAALVTLSIRGIKVNQAMTQIRGIFAKLIKPTTAMKDLFREMGVSSGEELIQSLGGLEGFLQKLSDTTQGNTTELGKYISRLRGLTAGAVLTSREGLEVYRKAVEAARNSTESFNKAVELTTQNIGKRFQIELNKAKNAFLTDFGIPIIKTAVKAIDWIGGMERATIILAKTVTAVLIPAVAALTVILLKLAVTSPFGLLVTTAALATIAAATLIEKIQADQEAYTKTLQEEEKKRSEAIQKGVNDNVKAAEDGLKSYTSFIAGIFANTKASLNKQIDETVAAFERADKSIDIILGTVRKRATDALQSVSRELKNIERDIGNTADEIDKLLQATSTELFQIEIADLDVGDQIKRVEEALKSSLDLARSSTAGGQADIVKRRLKDADDLFKQLRQLQSKAEKDNEKNIKRRSDLQAKISKKEAEAASKRIKLEADLRRAQRSGDRDKVDKIEQNIAESLRKENSATGDLERKLRTIKDIEFERVNLAKQLIEVTNERIKILEIQRQKDLDTSKRLKEQEAQLEKFKNQIVEATKRVEKFDIKDLLEQDTLQSVNTLLQDRIAGIQRVIELGKDDRLGTKLTAEEQERLVALQNRFTEVANQRTATLRVEIERQRILNKLREQRENVRAIATERAELEKTRASSIADITRLQKALSDAKGRGTLIQDLETLKEALDKGIIDQDVIDRAATLQEQLKSLSKEAIDFASRLATERFVGKGLGKELFGVETFTTKAAQQQVQDIGRIAQLTANRLNSTEQLLQVNKDAIAQQERLDALLKRIATATGAITVNTQNNNTETKTYADRVQDVQDGWTGVVLEVQTLNALLDGQARKAEDLLRLLDQFNLGIPAAGKAHGGVMRFANGGAVGTDSVPAMLSQGEFVVNAQSSKKFFSQLVAMNAAGNRGFSNGGNVTNVGDINVNMASSGNESVDVSKIGKLLKREIRRGTLKL